MSLRNDYRGRFDPDLTLADFSRRFLVRLGHEYLLIGHMLDRVGQPLVGMEKGIDAYVRSAIEEWMGASPIYSLRMQRLLDFEGDEVGTVFKNIQLEIGAPQQFMDFQFRLDSPDYGEFWLAHCGALMDVEPHGEDGVKLMCHDIEDPTFDATAAATNPKMIMRPIHRPPRVDSEGGSGEHRWPHCRWSVSIGDDNQDYEQHPHLAIVEDSLLASIGVDQPEIDGEPGGWADYSGPFDPGCQLADFSHRALVGLVQEFAVQTNLLMRSYMVSQEMNYGPEVAQDLARRMWTGHAAAAVERLQKYLGVEGDDIETIAKVFQLHPHFQPRTYTDVRIEVTGEQSARISMADCPALNEKDDHTWFSQLGAEPHPAVQALVRQVNPQATCHAVADPERVRFAWDVVIDPDAEPAPEPPELGFARMSQGMTFQFEQRRLLRVAAE